MITLTLLAQMLGTAFQRLPLRRLGREERGQAAVEYAVMTAYLIFGAAMAGPLLMKFAPNMLDALQIYLDGFYFTLSLPLP